MNSHLLLGPLIGLEMMVTYSKWDAHARTPWQSIEKEVRISGI